MTASLKETPISEEPVGQRRHIAALDGARGAAVIAVLLFHGGMLKGGYLGVDLFFVLSGYLITSLLLAETARNGTIGLGGFWAKRARRLLPALFLMLLAVCAYAIFVAKPTELSQIRADFFATLGYVANWRLVLARYDYWRIFTSPSPLNHTWSLAIEEQFYVVWPLVAVSVGLIIGRGRTAVSWARGMFFTSLILSLVSAAIALQIWYSSKGTVRIYYGTDTRAAAILFGAALASWIAWRGPVQTKLGRRSLELLGLFSTGVLVFAYFRLDQSGLYSGGLLICSVGATALIATITHPDSGPLARAFSARPLVAAGIISYGLYLWHWPIYVWLNAQRVGWSGWPLLGVRLAATVAIALISYRFVEKPIRYGAISAKTLRWLTPCAAALLVGLAFISTRGAEASPIKQKSIKEETASAVKNTINHPGASRVMIVGNSVGWLLANQGFAPLDREFNTVTLNAALPTCHFPTVRTQRGPELGAGNVPLECTAAWPSAVEHFDPDVVVLLLGAIHVGGERDGRWATPCDALYKDWTVQGLADAQRVLTSRGARLVISTTAYSPIFAFTPEVVPLTKCQNATVMRYAKLHPEVGLIDFVKRVCPKYDACEPVEHGARLRPDFLHYTGDGALLITRWIIPQLGLPKNVAVPSGPSRVMIVGNSVGWLLANQGFAPLEREFNMVALNAALPTCHFPTVRTQHGPGILYGNIPLNCTTAWPSAVEQFDPDVVVLLLGATHIGGERDGQWVSPCDPFYKEWTTQGLADATRVLTSLGARLVISTTAYSPIFGYTPEVVPLTKCQNATIMRYAKLHPEVGLIDLAKRVCPKYDVCEPVEHGVRLRPDFLHYTGDGALLITRWIIPQLGLPKNIAGPSGATRKANR